MTERNKTHIIDELARTTKLELSPKEKESFALTLDDFCRLADELEQATPSEALVPDMSLSELREDIICTPEASPQNILSLSADTRDGYAAVPTTVEQ